MYTVGHILSSSSCTHFSHLNMKSLWNDSFHHAVEILSPLVLYGWSCKSEGCWNAKFTDVTTKAPNYEDKLLYFTFKLILLSIFYSLSLYHSTNVIILLECHQPIIITWLEPQITWRTKWCYTAGVRNIKEKSIFLYFQDYIIKYMLIHYYFTARCKLF